MLSFPSLWSKLVLNASISQSEMVTLVDRSGSHPLQVEIPPAWSEVYPKSNRYKHIELVIKHLPRVSQLTINTLEGYDTCRVRRMFRGSTADQLLELNLKAPFLGEFVPCTPRLRSLSLSSFEFWLPPLSDNITHICLDCSLDPDILEIGLKNCAGLKELSITQVRQLAERPGDHPQICLLPGVRLMIKDSHTTVASLFALGSTNYLSIRATFVLHHNFIISFLEQALPRDVSHLRNLVDPTMVYLKLADTGERPNRHNHRGITVILKCSTGDRETLHVEVEYYALHRRSPDPMEMGIVPERSPMMRFRICDQAMRLLNYLHPLNLREVVELRMEGFVGEWNLYSVEIGRLLKRMPALRRIVTGDDNKGKFLLALLTMERSVVIEEV